MTTTIDFPCCLPGVLVSNFRTNDFGHYQTNDVQTGAVRLEFLTDDSPMSAGVSWSFSAFDFQMFEAWFRRTLNLGVLSFNIDLWVGQGLVSHECYFIDPDSPYSVSKVGKRFRISANLIAIAHQYNDDCRSDSLLALCEITVERDTCRFLEDFQEFANVNLPNAWEGLTNRLGTDHST